MYNKNGHYIRNRCYFEGSRATFYRYHFQWIFLVFVFMVPFTVLIIGNSMIIYKMIKYNAKRKRMCQENKSNDSQSMTAMLICISLLFSTTQVPAVIIQMVRQRLDRTSKSAEYLATFYLIDTVCRQFRWTKNSVNFFCYCISGK